MTEDLARARLHKLAGFFANNPSIQHATPSSPKFAELRAAYVSLPDLNPLVIARPSTVEAAASMVSFVVANDIPFTIRSGGHDSFGRFIRNGAVAVDMRLINYVEIDQESSTARIGGGILGGDFGTVSSVGYAGWAMYGGYGPYSSKFGLGVDQILAAKVINAQGELVDADTELLKALRGAGGAFGVVAELTIPVHRLAQTLAGAIAFQSDDLPAVIRQYNTGYQALCAEGIPAELTLQQSVLNLPHGKTLVVLFVWASSDIKTGQLWAEKISALAPVAHNAVQSTTPLTYLTCTDRMVPSHTRGRVRTISLKRLSEEVLDVISTSVLKMPTDPHTFFAMHEIRTGTPSAQGHSDSVFAVREGLFVFEIIANAQREENLDLATAWGQEFWSELSRTNQESFLPSTYLSLTAPKEVQMSRIFGENFAWLVVMRGKHDPRGVFAAATARL
ncbi:FAD-binding oxidoreductase [Aspergillus brunneoviolaceus CBS 621.78]|uniref:FAD-binding domain-containing protein n=1 Tax=Aspergillus brunneoviolaceus CBS 621.78 TaxID=1450534 RepID=A0ACD1FT39_9EURO|nr:FAD-binding domain-containing protein [Aspergillus brunneoviolaceus CBS 621.78]RAH40148.1 FAD-binding domain-containing protein [Aspergillus brunneoviolaceus CBS 621.78]